MMASSQRLCMVLIGLISTCGVAETYYYRGRSEMPSVLIGFSHDMWLHASNSAPAGGYLVQRSPSLLPHAWSPYVRHAFTNHLASALIYTRPPSPDLVFIPGGRFTRGDAFGEQSLALPQHEVTLNPFFMQRYEVTNEDMRQVYQWAYDQGWIGVVEIPVEAGWGGRMVINTIGATNHLYALDRFAQELDHVEGQFRVLAGKGRHPCVYVTWYGAVAYGHFRSLMEGRDSCYHLTDWSCDFTKGGYRLPTDAEWEMAGRGGYEGMRFPWGNTNVITHSEANYRSNSELNDYDVSPTQGYHPDYAHQALRTSPVGAFAPNAYGVYDMCGNVWEWFWDWRSRYSSAPLVNPTGPDTGTHKGFRGGSNYTTAERNTVAVRYMSALPEEFAFDVGFRCVMTLSP